jgi:hypothetical protein
VRDSIANLASIQTGPPRSDAAIPERPTLQNLAVPERPTVRDLEMPERPTVKDVEVPLGDSMFDAETSIGSTEVELEASEPALTMEVDDPRPTGELSAVQDVEGLLEGIPSGIPSETAAQDDTAVPTRSPKTRSSPNLAELWSSELERSTAKRAAVEASDESAMTPAESVVAITSSEPIAESTPTAAAAAPGTTTITSRRATTNTRLADAPAKPEQHAPPTAQDDDDGSSLLGAFGFDIQVKIDLPFDDDLGPTDFLTTSSVPTPTVTAEPVVPEKSGKSKRPSKRSLTKPPLEDATDSAPLERRSSKSIPSADTPSRRSSDRLTRPPSVAASNETSPAADDNSVDKSGRTPSARAIEKAIDRQIAGRDPVGGSRVWLYVIIAIALGGIGVLVYLKLT